MGDATGARLDPALHTSPQTDHEDGRHTANRLPSLP